MDAVIYQPKFLAVSNTVKKDIEYISDADISKMQEMPIITIKNYYTIEGEMNVDDDLYIVSEGNDNSFICIFAKTIAGVTNLKIKRKLNKQEVNKLKRLWQTKE